MVLCHTEKLTMWAWVARILTTDEPPGEYRDALKMPAPVMHLFDTDSQLNTYIHRH